jgi:hypothetical protein
MQTKSLYDAIEENNLDRVKVLINDPSLCPVEKYEQAICWAAQFGQSNIVAFLLSIPEVKFPVSETSDVATNPIGPLGLAAQNGHLETVRLLLADERKHHLADCAYAILFACINKQLSIIDYLLADPRIDLCANNNLILSSAISENHFDVIEYLFNKFSVQDFYSVILEMIEYEKATIYVDFLYRKLIKTQPLLMHSLFSVPLNDRTDQPYLFDKKIAKVIMSGVTHIPFS